MGKIVLSDDLKKKIANLTGLTYLASNIEKFSDTEGVHVDNLLNFYAPQRDALKQINLEVKAEIMKENPSLKLEIAVPGEGGLIPTEPEEGDDVTLTLTAIPSDAKITINDEEKSGITVKKGTQVTYKVEKDGYKTVEETIELTENKVIEVVLEEKVAPTISSDIAKSIETDTDVEYNVTTVANDYAGEMVYGECDVDIPDEKLNSIQYWEPNEEVPSWHDLPKNESGKYYFGVPTVGFPLSDATSKFKINVKEAGEYHSTINILSVKDKKVLCTVTNDITVTQKPAAEPVIEASAASVVNQKAAPATEKPAAESTTESVAENVAQKPATTAEQSTAAKTKTSSKK